MEPELKDVKEPKERNELEELERDIRRTITDNARFLEKVLDDDFEPEDGEEDDSATEEPLEEL